MCGQYSLDQSQSSRPGLLGLILGSHLHLGGLFLLPLWSRPAFPCSSAETVNYIDVSMVRPALHSRGDSRVVLTRCPVCGLLALVYRHGVENFMRNMVCSFLVVSLSDFMSVGSGSILYSGRVCGRGVSPSLSVR